VLDVMPRRGRIYFPLAGKLAFKKGGWSGACSLWVNTNPNKLLKTPFCDPVRSPSAAPTMEGSGATSPNRSRGTFVSAPSRPCPRREADRRKRPPGSVGEGPKIDFEEGAWRHVVLNWRNFDTGRADGYAASTSTAS